MARIRLLALGVLVRLTHLDPAVSGPRALFRDEFSEATVRYKNFQLAKFWRTEINIGRIGVIRYNLESGQRDLSDDDIEFRVEDLEIRFW